MVRKFSLFILVFIAIAISSLAAYQGLSIATNYPALTVADTKMVVLDLTVHNYDLEPQRADLSVRNLPSEWQAQFVGGGGIVDAVFVAPDESTPIQLWIAIADDAVSDKYNFIASITGQENSFDLPLTINIGKNLPERLALTAQLPTISGSVNADFTFDVELRNNSARDILVNLETEQPQGFKTKITEQYSSGKELISLPLKSGEKKQLRLTVIPPSDVSEALYPITLKAATESVQAIVKLAVDVKGEEKLLIEGVDGLLSTNVVAGKAKTVTVTLKNEGTSDADEIKLSSYKPNNWSVTFNPDSVKNLKAKDQVQLEATITSASDAITGDYSVSVTAKTEQSSVTQNFRVTVRTSSWWGLISILIIGCAAVILVLAIRKFGRR